VVAGAVQSVLALVGVTGFGLAGLDPFSDLLICVNTPGIIGIVLLQAAAAVAAVAFFLRRPDAPRRGLLIASSILAAFLMVGVVYLMVDHIETFTGASDAVNESLLAVIPAVVLVAVAAGLLLRRWRPATIAHLGSAGDDGREPDPTDRQPTLERA